MHARYVRINRCTPIHLPYLAQQHSSVLTSVSHTVSTPALVSPTIVSTAACQGSHVTVHHVKQQSRVIGRMYRQIRTHTPFRFCSTSQLCSDLFFLVQSAPQLSSAPQPVRTPVFPFTTPNDYRLESDVRTDRFTLILHSDSAQHHGSVLTSIFLHSGQSRCGQHRTLSACLHCRSPCQATTA